MKINELQIETVKGKYGRYGLSTTNGRMMVQITKGEPYKAEFTAEEAHAFSAETSAAAVVLLVDDVRNVEPSGDKNAAQNKPQEAPARRYTMEDFKVGKIAVIIQDKSSIADFLKMIDISGLKFSDHDRGLIDNGIRGVNDAFALVTDKDCAVFGKVSFASSGYWQSKGYDVVPFVSFNIARPAPLTVSPNLFTCAVTDSTTSAEVNAIIDRLRAIRYAKQQAEQPKPAEKPAEPQYREVKRKAKKGDRIKIVASEIPGGLYKNGDILTVSESCEESNEIHEGVHCRVNGWNPFIYTREYVVLDPIPATPAAPWKPRAGELVYIASAGMPYAFAPETFVKIESFCVCGSPKAKDTRGITSCLNGCTYLPVREEERPANVGDYIIIKGAYCTFNDYKNDDVLRVVKLFMDEGVEVDIPDSGYVNHKEYRVLVPYDPTEAAK